MQGKSDSPSLQRKQEYCYSEGVTVMGWRNDDRSDSD